jgi:hypothetical protein
MEFGKRKKPKSQKGMCPEAACYGTQTDHRRQVEQADTKRRKNKLVKQRRNLDKLLTEDNNESLPDDVLPERKMNDYKNWTLSYADKSRRNPMSQDEVTK